MRTFALLRNAFLLFPVWLIATDCIGQNTIPNAGFENWTMTAYEDPDDWFTPNQGSYLSGVITVEKTTDAYSGTYAIRLETKDVVGQTIPGTAVAGVLDPFSLEVVPGFPICSNPTSLSGWFKYFPVFMVADVGSIELLLSKWNPTLMVREPVGTGIFTTPIGNTSSYTSFTTNIIYTSTDTADTVIITLISGSYTQPPGSVLYIDDLTFSGPTLSTPTSNFSASDAGGGQVSFSDQTSNSPTSWSWTFGDGNSSTLQNPSNLYATVNTTYQVCLTTTNCAGSHTFCDSVFVMDTTTVPILGIESDNPIQFTIYPNPAIEILSVTSSRMDLTTLQIKDLQGRLVVNTQISGPTTHIDLHKFANGIYAYNLLDKSGVTVQSGKLVVANK
ncbi:MAG: T9SS type A sorting domain-containing protein [Flavobacteriales bacterium]|nr:T9SS type A sorting domain-containing protein [Flavobacteriales bacterium]